MKYPSVTVLFFALETGGDVQLGLFGSRPVRVEIEMNKSRLPAHDGERTVTDAFCVASGSSCICRRMNLSQ